MSNIDTVQRFIQAMAQNQKNEILSFFDDESIFNNVPMHVVKGREAIWGVLGRLHEKALSVEYVIHHIAEGKDGTVLTERTDRYELADGVAEFPVMGIFELEGGTIREWRDYFDLKQCLEELSKNSAKPV
jgi:limonene-1,2-epoxide hydrolase